MESNTAGKKYYLRHAGRITGPFPMLKLTAMYNRGALSCDDMISVDKRKWDYVNLLFPALSPGTPIALIPVDPPPVSAPDGSEQKRKTDDGNAGKPDPADSAGAPEELQLRQDAHPLQEWIRDIGRTVALFWDFQEIQQKHVEKAGRFYGIASGIHFLLGIGIVLLFGKYYSRRFHCIFSPLTGVGLLAAVWIAASLTGWLAAKRCAAAGQNVSPSWKICAAGIFMNYGTLACCFMALAHGLQHLWVQSVLVFIDSFVLCSSSMLLRGYLEAGGRSWKGPVFTVVFLFNPGLVLMIYGFKFLI